MKVLTPEFDPFVDSISRAIHQGFHLGRPSTKYENKSKASIKMYKSAAEYVIASLNISDLETMASYKRTIAKYENTQ